MIRQTALAGILAEGCIFCTVALWPYSGWRSQILVGSGFRFGVAFPAGAWRWAFGVAGVPRYVHALFGGQCLSARKTATVASFPSGQATRFTRLFKSHRIDCMIPPTESR